MERYKTYSRALKERFGEKVYKLPVQLPVTCPNRDGTCGTGGCTFCGEVGAGFENLSASLSVKEQIELNRQYIGTQYNAAKFIAYFNNFSNTYLTPEALRVALAEAFEMESLVGISLSTRPDCVSEAHLEVIERVLKAFGRPMEITIELGLQSINPQTMKQINRGHGVASFVEAALRIKKHGFRVCAHLIGNLPWDQQEDLEEAARLLTVLGVEEVKLHSLYILKGTRMGAQYEAGELEICSPEAYAERVAAFVRLASPEMVFQRFAGRAPEEETLFCNWGMSWWRIKDLVDRRLEELDAYQGDRCDYLDGPAVRKFL